MSRRRLPARRPTRTFSFEHEGPSSTQKYHATVGYYDIDCLRPGELFLNSSQKAGSEADIFASDAAIAISLALQHGCKLELLRHAVQRTSTGKPSTAIGH